MRTILIPALALAMTLAAPAAFGQSNSQKTAATAASPAPPSAAPSQAVALTLMTKDKVKQSLQQAGFKDVKVLDESFLVSAQTADGTSVVMVINPPTGSAAQSASNTGSQASGSSGAAPANPK